MELDGITPQDIINSLDINNNKEQLSKAGEGSGKSGQFFFFSHDKKLIIKTLRGPEKHNLLNMLKSMVSHLKETGNLSLLCRIYGFYTIKSSIFKKQNVIVMQNIVQKVNP